MMIGIVLDDAVKNGLLIDVGTELNRVFKLTKKGRTVANLLREHKTEGGTFQNFSDVLIKINV